MNTVFLNGKFLDTNDAKISIFDHGFLYGDALYETLLVYNGKICFFEEHWHRFIVSAKRLQFTLPKYFDSPEKVQKIFKTLIEKNSCFHGRLRLSFSRGENSFNFTSCPNPTVSISLSPLAKYPEKIYTDGVSVQKIFYKRSLPELKTNNSIASVLGRQEISATGNFEGIFCEKNFDRNNPEKIFLREGTVSNILAVVGKNFWTAPKKTVLPGTMQGLVENILLKNGYTNIEKNFSVEDIIDGEGELYILNSLFGVVPVREVDGEKIPQKKNSPENFPVFDQFFGKNFFERWV